MSNNFIKRFSLVKDILMFLMLILLMLTPFGSQRFGDWFVHLTSFHMLFGIILTVLFVIHICLNFKWLTGTIKNWGKAPQAAKAKFWMMILVLIFMSASIITGIIWGLGIGVTPTNIGGTNSFWIFDLGSIRTAHATTSWAAFYLTGIHVGLHLTKFLSFLPKKAKPAPTAKPE